MYKPKFYVHHSLQSDRLKIFPFRRSLHTFDNSTEKTNQIKINSSHHGVFSASWTKKGDECVEKR